MNQFGDKPPNPLETAPQGAEKELAAEIDKLLFTFDDIVYLDDVDIKKVLEQVDNKELALALRHVHPEIKKKILSNLSEETVKEIEEISYMGPVRLNDVEVAQQRIVDIIRQLEKTGEVKIGEGVTEGINITEAPVEELAPKKSETPLAEVSAEKEFNLEAELEKRGLKNGAEFTFNSKIFQIISCGPSGICYSPDGTLIGAKWFLDPQEFFALQNKGEIVVEGATLEPTSKTPKVPPVKMEDLEINLEDKIPPSKSSTFEKEPDYIQVLKDLGYNIGTKFILKLEKFQFNYKIIDFYVEQQRLKLLDQNGKEGWEKAERIIEFLNNNQLTLEETLKEVPKAEIELFTPTGEWQEVPKDVVLPIGMEIKMNLETGKNMARDPKLVSEPEKELTHEVSALAGQAAGKAQEFLEKKLGYLDVKPQAIFDQLTDDEIKNLEEFFKNNNEEPAKALFKNKIDEILTNEQKQTLLNEAGAQEVASNVYKILQETIENEARYRLAKMDFKKAGKITKSVLVNAGLVWSSAILLGTLGISTAGIGSAAGLALISFGYRKYSQIKREKNAAKTSAKYQADFTKEKEHQQEEFFKDEKAKEKLAAVISNELRRQSSQKAKQALNEYEAVQVAGSPEQVEKSLANLSEELAQSAYNKLASEHPDWSQEQIIHSAQLVALTLIQHERNENTSKAQLEELKKSQPKVYQLINKFNLLRSGQIDKKPEDVNPSLWNKYKYDLLSIGLGTGIGLAVRTNQYARIASGALAGAGYGYFMAEHFGRKKGEEKALLAVERMINEAEAKIRDITFPSEELGELSKDALYVQGRLNLGILDKSPLLKSRAENFIHQVNQLEYKNQQALDDLYESEYKKGEQLEEQQKADVLRLEKKIKKYRTIGLVGGAIFGGITAGVLPEVSKEIRSWFGQAPVSPEKVPITETPPAGLPESIFQKLQHDFPDLKLDKPIEFTTKNNQHWHYNPADSTVFSEADSTHKISLTDFLSQEVDKHKGLTSALNQEVLETPVGEKDAKVAPPPQKTPVPPSAEALPPALADLAKNDIFKGHLPEAAKIIQAAKVQKGGSISEALNKAMSPDAKVTVINPNGQVIKNFDANLTHEGDTVIETKDGDILVYKSSEVAVKEGMSLAGRYDEIAEQFKLKEIPQEVKDAFNLDKAKSGFYERLNYQEAKGAFDFWNQHKEAINQLKDKTAFYETLKSPSGIEQAPQKLSALLAEQKGISAEVEPLVEELKKPSEFKTITLNEELSKNLDLKFNNGQVTFMDSNGDENPDFVLLDIADQQGQNHAMYYAAQINDKLTLAQAINNAHLADKNLTSVADILGLDNNTHEAAKFWEVYGHSEVTNVPTLDQFGSKGGQPFSYDWDNLKGLTKLLSKGEEGLNLLKINGEYSAQKFELVSKMAGLISTSYNWQNGDIKEILQLASTKEQLAIARHLIIEENYRPNFVIQALEITRAVNLLPEKEQALAELVVKGTRGDKAENINDEVEALFGSSAEAKKVVFKSGKSQLVFKDVTVDGKKIDQIIINAEKNKIIIKSGKTGNEFNLTDENLTKVKEQLSAETPVAEALYSQEILDLQKQVESGLGIKFTPETIIALQKDGYQITATTDVVSFYKEVDGKKILISINKDGGWFSAPFSEVDGKRIISHYPDGKQIILNDGRINLKEEITIDKINSYLNDAEGRINPEKGLGTKFTPEINLESPLKGIADNTYDIENIGEVVVKDGQVLTISGNKVELGKVEKGLAIYTRMEGSKQYNYGVEVRDGKIIVYKFPVKDLTK